MKRMNFALLASACSVAASLLCGSAFAQSKTLYIGMNGGTMEKTYTEHVFGAFEKANNVKVVVVPGTSSDILAKAQKPLFFFGNGCRNALLPSTGMSAKERAAAVRALAHAARASDDDAWAALNKATHDGSAAVRAESGSSPRHGPFSARGRSSSGRSERR